KEVVQESSEIKDDNNGIEVEKEEQKIVDSRPEFVDTELVEKAVELDYADTCPILTRYAQGTEIEAKKNEALRRTCECWQKKVKEFRRDRGVWDDRIEGIQVGRKETMERCLNRVGNADDGSSKGQFDPGGCHDQRCKSPNKACEKKRKKVRRFLGEIK
ncbi:9047_t:CDS:1, partial [Gigaspora margarita]